MITHIKGKLVEKTPTYVIVDVNGIGYKIKITLQTFSAIEGEFCMLYTHLSIKEDSHTLFGFHEQIERHLFRNLISVSGVGPSTAQVILSTYSPMETINHITTADVKAIEKEEVKEKKKKIIKDLLEDKGGWNGNVPVTPERVEEAYNKLTEDDDLTINYTK